MQVAVMCASLRNLKPSQAAAHLSAAFWFNTYTMYSLRLHATEHPAFYGSTCATMNCTIATESGDSMLVHGWMSQPNYRGTFDIVVSCLITIVLCSWSSICVNIPSRAQGYWDIVWDKWHLFCLGMLGPEFVFILALGQYRSACASVGAFAGLGHKNWTMTHAFFADMGGFVLQTPDGSRFPITATQLHYLVSKGHLCYPEISEDSINDRDKSDGLSRFVTLCQILWFTVSVVARPMQDLTVTTAEITTLGFIFCTVGTAFCWRHKPMDVQCPVVLETEATIYQIRLESGDVALGPYKFTPLDFVDREEWFLKALWTYYVNILKRMRIVRQRIKPRPIDRLSSFNFPKLSRRDLIVALILGSCYNAIFLAAWNFHFPSKVELLLWRATAITTVGLCIGGGLFEIVFSPSSKEAQISRSAAFTTPKEDACQLPGPVSSKNWWRKAERVQASLKNNSPDKDPAFDVPLRSLVVTTPLCALYVICRWYILLEDIVGFRALEESSFRTVEWSEYWPHF